MQSLNGSWSLCGRKESGLEPEVFFTGDVSLEAAVPGNIELELFKGGLVGDPYISTNARALRKYEFYEWCFSKTFEYTPSNASGVKLVFEGLDCCATIFVNGSRAGSSENAMITHEFEIKPFLKAGKNNISVHIASANNVFRKYPYIASQISLTPFNAESTRIRKPAHVWGWDIAPRMALGGIFRNVYLEEKPAYSIEGYLQMERLYSDYVRMLYSFKIESEEYSLDDMKVTVDGVCGDSVWHAENYVWSAQGLIHFSIQNPKLWWPRHYGEPNLYQVTVKLLRASTGEVLTQKVYETGIRRIRLHHSPVVTDSPEPDFMLYINEVPIRVVGFSHVPADSLHSKCKDRNEKIIDMALDLNVNMIRVWGGGIYESEEFYQRCSREGIMVWQDFMMACSRYPDDQAFHDVIAQEAESAVKRLRYHTSIVLWAGDNECDCTTHYSLPRDPNNNRVTRAVLPEVCRLHDNSRPFIPSTPWCSSEAVEQAKRISDFPLYQTPEQHIWGREFFKENLYTRSKASFLSEVGIHGCPGISSIKKFVSPDKVWPWMDNDDWFYHASNAYRGMYEGYSGRIPLMEKLIHEMFGIKPDQIDEFILASQITQAEGLKSFIEFIRSSRKRSGILFWNLIDCWPQFSDSIVDYYYNKKLAYYYAKRLYSDVLIQISEPESIQQWAIISNYSDKERAGHYKIYDADTNEIFDEADFRIKPNETKECNRVGIPYGKQRMLLIEWTLEDGTKGCNHLLCGFSNFNFEQYKGWLKKIAALDGSFDPEQVGK